VIVNRSASYVWDAKVLTCYLRLTFHDGVFFYYCSCGQTLEMLEKKECFLQKKCSAEIEKAKDYTKSKNKNAAIQCLKKKKLYETQIEQLSNFQLRVHDQIIMLESAKATTDTVDALRSGSSAVKAIQQSL